MFSPANPHLGDDDELTLSPEPLEDALPLKPATIPPMITAPIKRLEAELCPEVVQSVIPDVVSL